MSKKIIWVVVIIVILGGLAMGSMFLFYKGGIKNNTPTNTIDLSLPSSTKPVERMVPTSSSTMTISPPTVVKTVSSTTVIYKIQFKTYTMVDVAKHSDVNSCWVVVRNNIYDMTNYVGMQLKNKQTVLGLCGQDGTTAFVTQYGGQMSIPEELARLEIGVLTQ